MDTSEHHPNSRVDGEVTVSETVTDWSETKPSTAIMEAIASIEDTDPVGLAASWGTTLYDHVDPDALNKLVRGNNTEVTFSIADYDVWIGGSELVVTATDSAAPHSD